MSDRRGFAGEIIQKAPSEASADSELIDLDFRLIEIEELREHAGDCLRRLGRSPKLHLAIAKPGGAILRLQVRMGEEWVSVEGFDDLGRAG